MTLTGAFPVLMSADVAAAGRFYQEHFGFAPTFTSEWYVSLQRDAWELAILDPTHSTIPAAYRTSLSGLIESSFPIFWNVEKS